MDFRKLIADTDQITELTESRMQHRQEAERALRAQPAPAPPPAPRPSSSRMRRGSSQQSLTSNLSRARLSDVMDLDPPDITPRSTRGSQRGSPIKRASESPEKERPQEDRRVSSSSMSSRTMQSSDLPLEEAEASLSFARLLMPDGSHRPLSDLEEDRKRALEISWDSFKLKTEPFRRWWTVIGSTNQCCGGKVVSRMDADWEEERFACKTCPKAKPPRPCLRLHHTGQRRRSASYATS